MLAQIKLDSFQIPVRLELEKIKQSVSFMEHIGEDLNQLSGSLSKYQTPHCEASNRNDRYQAVKCEIKDKIKSMGSNIEEFSSLMDHKIRVISNEIVKLQKLEKLEKQSDHYKLKGSLSNKEEALHISKVNKMQEEYKYKILQLEERIFDIQKRQNQYVKEISDLKSNNSKLREEFSNLSFDSNQKIKELSEKLHNNTSPNLGIKRQVGASNPETSFLGSDEHDLAFKQKRPKNNNFIKIKASPVKYEAESRQEKTNTKNMLDSLSSGSSHYEVNPVGYQNSAFVKSSRNLNFGCFPGKQISEKTKTGSSMQNKRHEIEEKSDKNRRFEFLLSNLRKVKPDPEEEIYSHGSSQWLTHNSRFETFTREDNGNQVRKFQI